MYFAYKMREIWCRPQNMPSEPAPTNFGCDVTSGTNPSVQSLGHAWETPPTAEPPIIAERSERKPSEKGPSSKGNGSVAAKQNTAGANGETEPPKVTPERDLEFEARLQAYCNREETIPPAAPITMKVYCAPQFAEFPYQALLVQPDLSDTYHSVIEQAAWYIDMAVYMLDMEYVESLREFLKTPGTRLRLIIDKDSVRQCKPVAVPTALEQLITSGAQIRKRKPQYGRGRASWAIQHEKTLLADGGLLLLGSHNFSANSAGNCEENSILTQIEDTVNAYQTHFEDIWELSGGTEELTMDDVRDARETKARQTIARSRSSESDCTSTSR